MLNPQPTVLANTHQPARETCPRRTSHCNMPVTAPPKARSQSKTSANSNMPSAPVQFESSAKPKPPTTTAKPAVLANTHQPALEMCYRR
jgi:hypothetical protein